MRNRLTPELLAFKSPSSESNFGRENIGDLGEKLADDSEVIADPC
jgi:hypothetical protein